MVMKSCLVLLALCCLHGDASYVTDLDVSTSAAEEQQLQEQNFTQIPVDLNKGAGGRDIHLWSKTGDSPAITRLQLTFNYNMSQGLIEAGFTKINKDLNAGAGGDEIYLWYFRGHGQYHTPIKEISVTADPNDEPPKLAAGWEGLACNLNRGAGGVWIRLWVKRTQQTYIRDIVASTGFRGDIFYFQAGYIRLDEDTNRGAGGANIFIWYRLTTDPSGALTALQVSNSLDQHALYQEQGYTPIGMDFNEGTGSDDSVYLWFKRQGSNPITAIVMLLNPDAITAYKEAGANVIERNLNSGNGGHLEYICVKQ